MTERIMNILMVGVGGQGILLASDILSEAAMNAGHDVKKSEVHGMSQRGGSVFSHVRFGKKVHSPLIPKGGADVLLSLEEMETLRWLDYANPATRIIVSTTRILPANVTEYPAGIMEELRKQFRDVAAADAGAIAAKTGNRKFINTALLGLVSAFVPFTEDAWKDALNHQVPPGTFEKNLEAFRFGREMTVK